MYINENLQSNELQTESYIKFSKSHTQLVENKETLENPAHLLNFTK